MIIPLLICILAAPAAGPVGACADPDDRAWLAMNHRGLADTSKDCAFACLTDDAACAARCMREETGLSPSCADCFGAFIDCTTSSCALRCIAPSSDMCASCQARHCEPTFERCAGIPIHR